MAFDSSRFNNAIVNQMIDRQGERVLCYPAVRCTCGVSPLNMNARASNPNCTLCGGWGWFYQTPVEIRGTISNYDMRRDPMELANMAPGDLTLSVSPRSSYIVADYDKVVLPRLEDGEPFSGELLQRGFGATIDRLRFPVVKMETVSTVDAQTFVPTFYTQGVDFTVSGDGITWLSGGANPAPGTIYSVRYRARFEWIAYAPPSSRHARGSSQGQRVLLRRRDMTPLTNAPGALDPVIAEQ